MFGFIECVSRKIRKKCNYEKSIAKQNLNKIGKKRKKNLNISIGLIVMNNVLIYKPV